MSRLDDLPPDQKAALSLLLRRRESYAGLAAVLNISERAVHDRAHAALAMLAPQQARALTPEQREEIGEFLLGQERAEDARGSTVRLLEVSPDARAWAQALVSELAPIGDGALPRIPTGAVAPAPADPAAEIPALAAARAPAAPATTAAAAPADAAMPEAPYLAAAASDAPAATAAPERPARAALPVSRAAGAVLLALLITGVVLAVVLIPSGGGSSKHPAASSKAPASRGAAASTGGAKPAVDKRITLTPAEAGSHAKGVALVLSEGGKYAFYLAAEGLPPTNGFFYAVWLYNSPTHAEPLGKSAPVSSNGRLQGGALLPSDAGSFSHLVVTRETNEHPGKPGPIVLGGQFALH